MKIVKLGDSKNRIKTCHNCDCDISYKNSERTEGIKRVIELKLKYYYIICPHCGHKIEV